MDTDMAIPEGYEIPTIPYKPSELHRKMWEQWMSGRPDEVVKWATKLPPWDLYLLTTTGQIVQLSSLVEDEKMPDGVSVTVNILPEDNPDNLSLQLTGAISVFGINPEDLQTRSIVV